MFKHSFSFNGRIRRTGFGISYIIYMIFYVMIRSLSKSSEYHGYSVVVYIFLIPFIWFLWAQGAKRCHDRGNSGLYQILPFYLLWMLFGDSDIGDNGYAPNPKGIGNGTEIENIGNKED
jgi:uncharacterized membrane protein YhaH (DUF805 family)